MYWMLAICMKCSDHWYDFSFQMLMEYYWGKKFLESKFGVCRIAELWLILIESLNLSKIQEFVRFMVRFFEQQYLPINLRIGGVSNYKKEIVWKVIRVFEFEFYFFTCWIKLLSIVLDQVMHHWKMTVLTHSNSEVPNKNPVILDDYTHAGIHVCIFLSNRLKLLLPP